MIFLMWNCRGLQTDTVVQALHGLIRQHKPSVVFLLETKMKNHMIEGVRRRMGYQKGFDFPPVDAAGGLSLWWNGMIEVNILSSSKNLIHSKLRVRGEADWFNASCMYGNPYGQRRGIFGDASRENWNWWENHGSVEES
ncbi:hypothetical protein TB1_024910 [Malus domestica]